MRDAVFNGRRLSLPECADELTPGLWPRYLTLAEALERGVIHPGVFCELWLSHLLGLSPLSYKDYVPSIRLQGEELLPVAHGFLVDSPGGGVRADMATLRNLWPQVDGVAGPGDALEGLTFGAMVKALGLLGELRGGDASAADRLARLLYPLPPEAELPPMLPRHCVTLVCNVWDAIMAGPIDVNGEPIDFRIIFRPSGPTRPADGTGWTGVTFEVAASGVFGDVRHVEATPMWDVLLYLYKTKFDYIHDPDNKSS